MSELPRSPKFPDKLFQPGNTNLHTLNTPTTLVFRKQLAKHISPSQQGISPENQFYEDWGYIGWVPPVSQPARLTLGVQIFKGTDLLDAPNQKSSAG